MIIALWASRRGGGKMFDMRKGRSVSLRGRGVVVLVAAFAALLTGTLQAHAAPPSRTVLQLHLSDVVDPFMASYVGRGIEQANNEGDAAVLLTIDTPGGLDSSMRDIVQSILASKVPVLCYTAPAGARAASAGTFIMLACPVNAMAPGTAIGAAHPVGVSGAIENEKVTNDAAAFIGSLANRWGRNAGDAEQAVRKATSWTAAGAVGAHLVDLQAPSIGGPLDEAGGCASPAPTITTGLLRTQGSVPGLCDASIQPFGMSISESLFHAFADPNVAFLLLNIGFIALIVWVIHPGFHVSLAVGVIFTVLGLAILETLPVRLVGVALLLVSSVLFVLDVKAKAHGVLTSGGIVTLVLGGLLLFNPSVPNAHVSLPLIIGVAACAGLFMVFVVGAILSAKETPVRGAMDGLVGHPGVTVTALEPTGLVRARRESWSAVSMGGPVPAGTAVRIVQVKGLKLLVEPEAPLAEPLASPSIKGRNA
jgi:membrane-bound serine protease (ClpP class)